MATNPLVSLPKAGAIKANLPDDLFVAVADCIRDTPTAGIADVLLPAAAWGEKDGTVTNSERRVSRQRPFLPLPGEARADWWILAELGKRLGFDHAFDYRGPAAIFREHAALVRVVERDLDFGDPEEIDDDAYEAWLPKAWPVARKERLFADRRFFTESGRARFVPIRPRRPAALPSARFPLVLNTGRYRDHWHTLTRTGRSVTLSRHRPEPLVELHPADAEAQGIRSGDLVRLRSAEGEAILRAALDPGQQRGQLFLPMHWNGSHNEQATVNRLVAPAVDPVSGQPESKAAVVDLQPVRFRHQGFLLARRAVDLGDLAYGNRSLTDGGWLHAFATDRPVVDWRAWLGERLSGIDAVSTWLAYSDEAKDVHRLAAISGDRLDAVLFIGADPGAGTAWLARQLASTRLDDRSRAALLLGTAPGDDPGPLVCACFGVGRNVIKDAIEQDGLTTTDLIGKSLSAGTNCGSCLPELRSLIGQSLER